jgi:hypothetical protein
MARGRTTSSRASPPSCMVLRRLYWRAVSVPAWKDDSDSDKSSTFRGDGGSLEGSNETARLFFSLPTPFDSTAAVVEICSVCSVMGSRGRESVDGPSARASPVSSSVSFVRRVTSSSCRLSNGEQVRKSLSKMHVNATLNLSLTLVRRLQSRSCCRLSAAGSYQSRTVTGS